MKKLIFFQLKELLKNESLSIHQEELKNFYTVATNYCNQRGSRGEVVYYEEMFDLYMLMTDSKIAYKGKYIKEKFVKNFMSLGLHLEKQTG